MPPLFRAQDRLVCGGKKGEQILRARRNAGTSRPRKLSPFPGLFLSYSIRYAAAAGWGVRRGVCSVRRPGWIPVSIARGGGALSVRRRYFLGQVRRCGGNGETANKGRCPLMGTDPCQHYRCAAKRPARQGQAARRRRETPALTRYRLLRFRRTSAARCLANSSAIDGGSGCAGFSANAGFILCLSLQHPTMYRVIVIPAASAIERMFSSSFAVRRILIVRLRRI